MKEFPERRALPESTSRRMRPSRGCAHRSSNAGERVPFGRYTSGGDVALAFQTEHLSRIAKTPVILASYLRIGQEIASLAFTSWYDSAT